MQGLHVFTRRQGGGGPLVHAAAGVPLLDLCNADMKSDDKPLAWRLITIRVVRAGQSQCGIQCRQDRRIKRLECTDDFKKIAKL